MPLFQYTAMDSSGKEKKGKLEAANEKAVEALLKDQGMMVTSIKADKGAAKKEARTDKGGKKKGLSISLNFGPMVIKVKDLTVLTRQLAILLDGGLPLIRSL